jgi:hypothetical protein
MDEPHLLAATRYIALNPVSAGLVSRAEDWPWSSARAYLAGEDDELATAAPLRARIRDFAALLTAPADPATTARIERGPHDRTAAWRAAMDRGARAAARPAPGTRQTGPKAPNGRGHQAAAAAAVRTQVNCHRNPQVNCHRNPTMIAENPAKPVSSRHAAMYRCPLPLSFFFPGDRQGRPLQREVHLTRRNRGVFQYACAFCYFQMDPICWKLHIR